MEVKQTTIKDLVLIKPRVFEDARGYFFESFNSETLSFLPGFVQDNQSLSEKNVLRGLHLQKGIHAQGKLVRVIKGAVLDVAVDIRENSPTKGKWETFVLDEENKHMLYVPPGFAHGFLTLSDNTIFSYKCTQYYNKESEASIKWDDKDLNINWGTTNPKVSEKDMIAPEFKNFTDWYK